MRRYIARIRGTALNLLLPGKRGTLAGVIRVLTATLVATVQLQRTVAWFPQRRRGIDGGEQLDLSKLTTADLIKIKDGMDLLRSQPLRQRDCPAPPPPEPIDDLCRPLARRPGDETRSRDEWDRPSGCDNRCGGELRGQARDRWATIGPFEAQTFWRVFSNPCSPWSARREAGDLRRA